MTWSTLKQEGFIMRRVKKSTRTRILHVIPKNSSRISLSAKAIHLIYLPRS